MFGTSVSGIKNSQKHIDVTSNNISNTNSYGFKKSRAEFADVYANSVFTNSKTNAGMGVLQDQCWYGCTKHRSVTAVCTRCTLW